MTSAARCDWTALGDGPMVHYHVGCANPVMNMPSKVPEDRICPGCGRPIALHP